MKLDITIGGLICVRYDDRLKGGAPPEVVDDYLIKMRRTAIAMYDGIPDDDDVDLEAIAALTEDDES